MDLTAILLPSILFTIPSLLAIIVTPESRATSRSIPVPTNGDSGLIRGTACRIILDPINALLASSFSRNGIKDAATETNCFGETSTYSIVSGLERIKFKDFLQDTNSSVNFPSSLIAEFACAIVYFDSSLADKYSI